MAPRFAPVGDPDPKVRYLLPVNPGYVLLGLSLGNEGIQNGTTTAEKDAIYAQFESGIRGFVARSREHHIVPVVTLCYTRNDFTAVEYEYTRRMNLAINAWDVPSVNFLGAVDDGTGKWARGFWHDSLHPNAAGHAELARTFVPTAVESPNRASLRRRVPHHQDLRTWKTAGRSVFARRLDASVCVRLHLRCRAPLCRQQRCRNPWHDADRHDGTKSEARGGGRGTLEFETTTLTSAEPFLATIGVQRGMWIYKAGNGSIVSSRVKADGRPHRLFVSHYTARGETLFFVDGVLAGTAAERLEPKIFALGGPREADFKDLLIYRSALNRDEIAALEGGRLLQASLEVYSPLAEAQFQPGGSVANLAQSLTTARVGARSVLHSDQ
jgi:hypothetical protein